MNRAYSGLKLLAKGNTLNCMHLTQKGKFGQMGEIRLNLHG